ncbi:MAG: hypothetical protein ACK2T7_01225 [Anaerolineales bacterium]
MFPIEQILRSANQIFEAGIAITAFSLFIRSLTFRLADRVTRAFAVILACIVVIFSGESIYGALDASHTNIFWLHFQWVGIVFLPAAFQHFSDALQDTTGRPSRGRRRMVMVISYGISFGCVILLAAGVFFGPTSAENPYPANTIFSLAFTLYYIISAALSTIGIWRAYSRTKLRASRRRITYLLVGSVFLLVGAYPYMLLGTGIAQRFTNYFILVVILGNLGVFMCLLLMAYAVAFFGVPWPDRIVRSRLLKWVLRGPIAVFVMLALITVAEQTLEYFNAPYQVAIPIISVISVLLAEHSITVLFPYIERWLLSTGDGDHHYLLQRLSERLISSGDLRQFLEAILAGVCDQFQVSTGFVAAVANGGWEIVVSTDNMDKHDLTQLGSEGISESIDLETGRFFSWGDFWLIPLETEKDEVVGLIGVLKNDDVSLDQLSVVGLNMLTLRAEIALEDRQLQRQVLMSLEELSPKVDLLQRLRASIRFDQSEALKEIPDFEPPKDFSILVKDAFSHYWGGPKLTESPLIDLQIVKDSVSQNEGVPANALRAVLRDAMEQIKPEGERKFTQEWTLYNILDLKFLQGRKVRDVARRLSVSEADLYRKQRVAIETIANSIIEMETKARES